MSRTVGTCGACGGRVSVPSVWHGVVPPVPECESCGRTPKQPHGPKIEMDERPGRLIEQLAEATRQRTGQ